jgi:hypothetical protein
MVNQIFEETSKGENKTVDVMDSCEYESDLNGNQVLVRTSIVLRRAEYARIKKLCEIMNVNFSTFVENALKEELDLLLNNDDCGLLDSDRSYITSIRDIR